MFQFRFHFNYVLVKTFIFGASLITVLSFDTDTIKMKLHKNNDTYSSLSASTIVNQVILNTSGTQSYSLDSSRINRTGVHFSDRRGKSSFSPSLQTSNASDFSSSPFFNNEPLDLGYYISQNYNNSGYYHGYTDNVSLFDNNYQNPSSQVANRVDSTSLGQGLGSYFPTSSDSNNFDSRNDHTKNAENYENSNYSGFYYDGYLTNNVNGEHYYPIHKQEHGHHSHNPNGHNEEHSEFEIEDKVFSKTVVATKALKVGKAVFVFFMVLVVLAIAALGKLGVSLSPVVLPLALVPIGIIALLLFIPLFFLFVPLAATGLAGERKKRRRRSVNAFESYNTRGEMIDKFITAIEDNLENIMDSIETTEWN